MAQNPLEQTPAQFLTSCARALVMVLPPAAAALALAGTFGWALGTYMDVKSSQQVRQEVQSAIRPLMDSDKESRDRLARIETKVDVLFADRTAK